MAERETSACARPELAALLARYEHGLLTAEERRLFEIHVLECDACFAELERGAPVADAARQHAPRLLRALNRRGVQNVPGENPLRRFAQVVLSGVRRPAVLAPVLAAAVVAIVLLRPHPAPPDITQWASFPTDVAVEANVRGGGIPAVTPAPGAAPAAGAPHAGTPQAGAPGTESAGAAALAELITTARGHIAAGNYASAERFLRAARERAPESAEAAWLLGLALALEGTPERAIAPLEFAAASPDSGARAMALWVLANCHLKLRQTQQAVRRLEEVRAGGGQYADQAAGLLEQIQGFSHRARDGAGNAGR